MSKSVKSVLVAVVGTLLGIGLFAGIILIDNIIHPAAYIPTLESRLWGGYYESAELGKIWCVAKFYRRGDAAKMVVVTFDAEADVFEVNRRSSGDVFVEIHFTNRQRPFMNIDAKQLYEGRRYIWGRLLAGRWKDFWKRNEDIAIRGRFREGSDEFAIEPLKSEQEERHLWFYNELVKHPRKVASLKELDEYLTAIEE